MADETDKLLVERGKTHGEYSEHAAMTQETMRLWSTGRSFPQLSDMMLETLHMIAHKVGRITTGNPTIVDHWDDIAGYARLVADRLRKPVVHDITHEEMEEVAHQVPAEDSNKHAERTIRHGERTPWFRIYQKDYDKLVPEVRECYVLLSKIAGIYRAVDGVDWSVVAPQHFAQHYIPIALSEGGPVRTWGMIDRRQLTAEEADELEVHPIETNQVEWAQLPTFWPGLYKWSDEKKCWLMYADYWTLWGKRPS